LRLLLLLLLLLCCLCLCSCKLLLQPLALQSNTNSHHQDHHAHQATQWPYWVSSYCSQMCSCAVGHAAGLRRLQKVAQQLSEHHQRLLAAVTKLQPDRLHSKPMMLCKPHVCSGHNCRTPNPGCGLLVHSCTAPPNDTTALLPPTSALLPALHSASQKPQLAALLMQGKPMTRRAASCRPLLVASAIQASKAGQSSGGWVKMTVAPAATWVGGHTHTHNNSECSTRTPPVGRQVGI